MLRTFRFSIARIMGVILIMALGCAALRSSSEAWAGAMLLLTGGLMILAAVGALCRGPEERTWWLGFALFVGGYLALAHWISFSDRKLPTIALAELIAPELGTRIEISSVNQRWRWDLGWHLLPPTHRILHCLWALISGLLGCLLAGVLVAGPMGRTPEPAEETNTSPDPSRARWKRPALIALSSFWLVAITAAAGRWPTPGIWAGVGFLLACSLLGLTALAAAFRRGRDRGTWLGAALFGFGYLALTFGKSQLLIVAPHLPTERLINGLLRPGGPPISPDFPDFSTARFQRVKNEIIKRKLDEPIAMHFPEETPLIKVLTHIRNATREANFPGIPIYVDPVGLQNVRRNMTSTVQIDLDTIPAKDALRLCLKQLGLGFSVRQGFVMISDDVWATVPVYEDPAQVVGHSFLALIAAGVGGLAARFVTGRARRTRTENGVSAREHGDPGRGP